MPLSQQSQRQTWFRSGENKLEGEKMKNQQHSKYTAKLLSVKGKKYFRDLK